MVKNLPVKAGDTGSAPGPEDPTCCGAPKPCARHCVLRPRAQEPQLLSPHTLEPLLCIRRSRCSEKSTHRSWKEPLFASTRGEPAGSDKDPGQLQVKTNKYF